MSSSKKNILIFVAFYLPGYKSGGPVRTIANMVDQLGDAFHFKIVTADRDSFETTPYAGIEVNAWNRVGNADVYYVSPENRTFKNFRRILQKTPHDVVYLNSLFSTNFTIKPLLLRMVGLLTDTPVVIAPRGEFSEGALALKQTKKKTYLAIAKGIGLYRNLIWQASSTHEVADIQRVMGGRAKEISVAPDLPSSVPRLPVLENAASKKSGGPLKIVCLSRISPMKNLDFALHVLTQVKVPVEFDLFGNISEEIYWSTCKDLIHRLPAHICVNYKGSIPHEEVIPTLTQYDLFFLPTRGENYGHVIYETLAAGTPALISDQTPWLDFEKAGVGWVFPLGDTSIFASCIERFFEMDYAKRLAMRRDAQAYAANVSKSDETIVANRELFSRACCERIHE